MKRRTLLASIGAVGSVAVAGCVNVGGRNPESRSPDAGTDVGVVSSTIETVGTDCGTDDADASWEITNDAVVITGHRPAPNPCHMATIDGVQVIDGTLLVEVGVESDQDPEEVCVECVGRVEYEATVVVDDPDALESVDVHGGDW